MRRVASTKGAKGRADRAFSKLVRARGHCQRCGSTCTPLLQCAHIVSRRFSNTRCVLDNAWCLCSRCHLELTDWPNRHVQFAHETIGQVRYLALCEQAQSTSKVDWVAVAADLEAQLAELDGG